MKIVLSSLLFLAYQQPLPDGRVANVSHQLHQAIKTIETLQKQVQDADKRLAALEQWRASATPLLEIVPADGTEFMRIHGRLNTIEQKLNLSAP